MTFPLARQMRESEMLARTDATVAQLASDYDSHRAAFPLHL